jgi:hypothetical protein
MERPWSSRKYVPPCGKSKSAATGSAFARFDSFRDGYDMNPIILIVKLPGACRRLVFERHHFSPERHLPHALAFNPPSYYREGHRHRQLVASLRSSTSDKKVS